MHNPKICSTFAFPKRGNRELSSVGSERLPYKQRVGGSTPSAPTKKMTIKPSGLIGHLLFYIQASASLHRVIPDLNDFVVIADAVR